jgi:mRNA interferase YafQ
MKLTLHKQYIKDLKKAKLNQTNLAKLFIYVSMILNRQELPKEAKDHQLKGELKDFREFHISGDLVVLYRIENNALQLLRIGSHNEIFKG